MNINIPSWIKPGIWGGVIGVVLALMVGFGSGWVVTKTSAAENTERLVERAVIASLTPVCVAQFRQEENGQALLASLEKESSWERDRFVEKHGWATMPGAAEASSGVAEACARELIKIGQPS